jgi:hypothetical protein
MDNGAIELSHNEISLLLFALEGGNAGPMPDASSCEEACPVVESVEELLCGGKLDPKQQLVRHLNNHLREGLIETGMFELMAARQSNQDLSAEDHFRLRRVTDRIAQWKCEIKLDDAERRVLRESLSVLPRSSWITMPRILWRLKKKIKSA